MVINIISYTFLGIIFYLIMWDFKIFNTFQIFIFSIFSFAISMFISDKFKLSNNKFIKILQKFVFINSILALIALILYLFDVSIFNTVFCDSESESDDENNNEEIIKNEEESLKNKDLARVISNIDDKNEEYYSFKVKKDVLDNVMEKGNDLLMVGVKDIAPNLGIGAAAGKVASEAFKHTSGMAPAPRIGAVGATALATAAGTKIGIELGNVVMENKKK
uniref:LAGLIDADG homing endonuclease n=1 Tax=Tricholoma bakamatsutake TaxID=51221 RepID=A0A6C0W511_9AGAR|nr:LAGLIDADG homing endonuclease [Tricholoma bakamatsutake]QIC20210.1 LAGLIDADG homing endonuclease [Tricholoma bakamatsutake]